MFNEVKAMTPYKAKLLVLVRILESGNIRSLFDHLTEATENSNHGSHQNYQVHTIKDGGRVDRNVSSEFSDIFQSYMNAHKLGIMNKESLCIDKIRFIHKDTTTARSDDNDIDDADDGNLEQDEDVDADTNIDPLMISNSSNFFPEYLSIVTTPLPTLKLNIGKRDNILRGMHFHTIDRFNAIEGYPTGSPKLDGLMTKLKGSNMTGRKEHFTAPKLDALITQLGGSNMKGRFQSLSENYSTLQQCYIVLQDDKLIRAFEDRNPTNRIAICPM